MSSPPFPVTAINVDDLKKQVMELLRVVYEEKMGGASIGDVFKIENDVLELSVGAGFKKVGNRLDVNTNHRSIQGLTGSLRTIGYGGTQIVVTNLTNVAGALNVVSSTITIGNGLITNVV